MTEWDATNPVAIRVDPQYTALRMDKDDHPEEGYYDMRLAYRVAGRLRYNQFPGDSVRSLTRIERSHLSEEKLKLARMIESGNARGALVLLQKLADQRWGDGYEAGYAEGADEAEISAMEAREYED